MMLRNQIVRLLENGSVTNEEESQVCGFVVDSVYVDGT